MTTIKAAIEGLSRALAFLDECRADPIGASNVGAWTYTRSGIVDAACDVLRASCLDTLTDDEQELLASYRKASLCGRSVIRTPADAAVEVAVDEVACPVLDITTGRPVQ